MKLLLMVCWFTIKYFAIDAFKFIMICLIIIGASLLCMIVPSAIVGYVVYLMASSPEINPTVVKHCLEHGLLYSCVVGGGCVGVYFFVKDFIWVIIKRAIRKANKQLTKEYV